MSHEQSETIRGRDNNWYNVYGRGTGATQPMPLPRLFSFEQPSYSTAEEAANKAAWRSHMGEGQYATTPPVYGFNQTPVRPPYAPLIDNLLILKLAAEEDFSGRRKIDQLRISGIQEGLARLRGENRLAMDPQTGGAPPNEMVLRLFGFKE